MGVRLFYLFMIVTLTFSGVTSSVFAQQPTFTATPLTPGTTYALPKNLVVNPQGITSVIVKLKGSSLASYQGDIIGLPATSPEVIGKGQVDLQSPASKEYFNYLGMQHEAFKVGVSRIQGAKVTYDYKVVMNSVAVVLPADQVASLSNQPEVEAIYPDQLVHTDTDNSSTFIGAPTLWTSLGGQEMSGEGVIVGVIDTGIWPEHPSFSDPDPSGKAYNPPPAAPSGQPRQCNFSSGSNPGPAFTCKNKLIGAYRIMSTYDALIGAEPGYTSARDADGHGTHTSSTAAGNAGVQASIYGVSRGMVSGISPRSYVIMYKALGNQGGFDSDLAAAAEQAINDGVNVINYSVSGGSSPYAEATELAFLDDYNAGIFVAASAGNSGPAPETTDHRGPWVTTVAASTQNRAFANTVTLTADGGASLNLSGASITQGVGPAPVVVPASDVQCNNPFAAGSVTGKVVVCERGVSGRAQKGYNVLQGGAVGMILYNQAANVTDVETDNHYLPATHIQYTSGLSVLSFISSHTNVQATLTEGAKVAAQGDVMASFSSRGGPGQTLGVSKPDITAPGVQILAGASPQHLSPADDPALGPQGESFQAIAGTSMSSPHIAGAAALLKAKHPGWTPGQIKSALMTTAWTTVVKEDGVTPATVFDDGSGRVDLTKAGDPGLTFDVAGNDYDNHSADLWNVNYPSVFIPSMPGIITVQRTALSTLAQSSVWDTQVQGVTDFSIAVPSSLAVGAGQGASFNITIDARDVPIDDVRSAMVYLSERGGNRVLHVPVTFIRKQPGVTLTKSCDPAGLPLGSFTDCNITAQNTTFNDATVTMTDTLPLQLRAMPHSVTGGKVSSDFKTLSWAGTLQPAQPPDVTITTGASPAGGYLPLSTFGVPPVSGMGDETIANFNVPPFVYAGETYTKIGIVSDGYLVVGGGTGADIQSTNQHLPDPTPPNNILAPFWTDLNPGAAGAIRASTLSEGVNNWIVVDFDGVPAYSSSAGNFFQIWIGTNGVQDISYAYGTVGSGEAGSLTIGAENKFGNRGASYYYNGTGTIPGVDGQLVVNSVPGMPGETHTIAFTARGIQSGSWTNYAAMTSNFFQGINVASASGAVQGQIPGQPQAPWLDFNIMLPYVTTRR
jgi:subtilisin family serine protease